MGIHAISRVESFGPSPLELHCAENSRKGFNLVGNIFWGAILVFF
jgi:hypothetical protein